MSIDLYDIFTTFWALRKTSMETLEERRQDLSTKFAVACVQTQKYSELFPANDTTHPMHLRTSRKYKMFMPRPNGTRTVPPAPPPPTQCYLGYAYACSNRPPPPLSAKVRCVKSIRLDLFLLYTSLFQHPPPPPFQQKSGV